MPDYHWFTKGLFISGYNKCSAVAEMGDHLATIDMGRKVWGCCVPFGCIEEGRKPKQLRGTSTDMEWPIVAALIITLEGKR